MLVFSAVINTVKLINRSPKMIYFAAIYADSTKIVSLEEKKPNKQLTNVQAFTKKRLVQH